MKQKKTMIIRILFKSKFDITIVFDLEKKVEKFPDFFFIIMMMITPSMAIVMITMMCMVIITFESIPFTSDVPYSSNNYIERSDYFHNSNYSCIMDDDDKGKKHFISKILSMAIIYGDLWIYRIDHIIIVYRNVLDRHYDPYKSILYLYNENLLTFRQQLNHWLKLLWPFIETLNVKQKNSSIISMPNERNVTMTIYNSGPLFNLTLRYHILAPEIEGNNTYITFDMIESEPQISRFNYYYRIQPMGELLSNSNNETAQLSIISISFDEQYVQMILSYNVERPHVAIYAMTLYRNLTIIGLLCSGQSKEKQPTLFLVGKWRKECQPPFEIFKSIGFGFTIGQYLYFVSMKLKYYFAMDKYLFQTLEREFTVQYNGSIQQLFKCRRPTSKEWPPINPRTGINPFIPYRLKVPTFLKQIRLHIYASRIIIFMIGKYFILILIIKCFRHINICCRCCCRRRQKTE